MRSPGAVASRSHAEQVSAPTVVRSQSRCRTYIGHSDPWQETMAERQSPSQRAGAVVSREPRSILVVRGRQLC